MQDELLKARTQFAAPADDDMQTTHDVMRHILFHERHRQHHHLQIAEKNRVYLIKQQEAADADRALNQEARQSAKVGVKRERVED